MDSGYYGRIRGGCAIVLHYAQGGGGDGEQSRWGRIGAMVHLLLVSRIPLFCVGVTTTHFSTFRYDVVILSSVEVTHWIPRPSKIDTFPMTSFPVDPILALL